VLLARLQRHAERGAAGGVPGHPDDAAGHVASVRLARREERRVRAAVPHGHAEALRVPDGDVRAPLPRGRQQGEGEQVGRDRHERPRGMRLVAERAIVFDLPIRRGILQQGADHAGPELEARGIRDDGLHPARLRPGPHDRDRLRVASLGNHEHRSGAGRHRRDRFGQVHRFGGGGGFIEERGVGDRQGGEVGDHRLEIEQRLEPALRDLRLVRRVGRVPARVLDDVCVGSPAV